MTGLSLNFDEPVLMGIVNVTPDSFSDGGRYVDPADAVAHGRKLYADGAAILDIGGESTRPGASAVDIKEELARVIPVIKGLRPLSHAVLSVDTRHLEVMEKAIAAGADMINDITAFVDNPAGLELAAQSDAYVCLMHMQGNPQTMQIAPRYGDVFVEVYQFLRERIDAALTAGVRRDRIIIDPGIGFGKTLDHNLILLRRLNDFRALGARLMLGASRKRFIENIVPGAVAGNRLPGSLAAVLAGHQHGIDIFRVHDVAETSQALTIYRAILTDS